MILAAAFVAAALAAPPDERLLGKWQCTARAESASAPVRTFVLLANGTYAAGTARGRYRFDERSGRIDWVDGALRAAASNTRYRIDENSKPTIGTKIDRFDYRCGHAGVKPPE